MHFLGKQMLTSNYDLEYNDRPKYKQGKEKLKNILWMHCYNS